MSDLHAGLRHAGLRCPRVHLLLLWLLLCGLRLPGSLLRVEAVLWTSWLVIHGLLLLLSRSKLPVAAYRSENMDEA